MDNTATASNLFTSACQETQAILRGRISDSSRTTYELKILSFLTWVFDNRESFEGYIVPFLLERMEAMDAKDKAQ